MNKPIVYTQSLGEEIANSVTHGVGFLGALAVAPFLILASIPHGAAAITGASIFSATMILLYMSSTLYHAFPENAAKRLFRIFDHAAIYLLIAGTYTPFTFGVLGEWGWWLFGSIWTLAACGVVLKSVRGARSDKLSTGLYLGMGWLAVLAVKPLYANLPGAGLFWLLLGGFMYSAGVFFFVKEHIRYSHFIWHLFVLAGTACHVIAIWLYVY